MNDPNYVWTYRIARVSRTTGHCDYWDWMDQRFVEKGEHNEHSRSINYPTDRVLIHLDTARTRFDVFPDAYNRSFVALIPVYC